MLEILRIDATGGEVTFKEDICEFCICAPIFKWEFDKDINLIGIGEGVEVTMKYRVVHDKCVAGGAAQSYL